MSTAADTGRLPKRAKLQLRAMLDAEADAHTLLIATVNRISELFGALKVRGSEDSARDTREEIERLQGIKEQQQRRHMELANINGKVRRFLLGLPPLTELQDVLREKVRRQPNESILVVVNRVREEIRIAQSEVRKLHHAGPRVADMKRAARRYVENLAAVARPKITASYEEFSVRFDTGNGMVGPNLREVLAWLDPETFLKRLEDEIDAMPVPALALSARERNERLVVAKEKLLALEHQEEALIQAASEDGEQIVRRYDADPAAVLGVRIKRRKAVAA